MRIRKKINLMKNNLLFLKKERIIINIIKLLSKT
jgi:hypothetical protein